MFEPKKVDGRRNNGGNKGCGRKAKSYESKLAEKLTPYNDEIIEMMVQKALQGDKDMIKLYMGYLHGQPKVSTTNDTNLTVASVELKDLISFRNDNTSTDNFFDED